MLSAILAIFWLGEMGSWPQVLARLPSGAFSGWNPAGPLSGDEMLPAP